jgi:hypothetical protein
MDDSSPFGGCATGFDGADIGCPASDGTGCAKLAMPALPAWLDVASSLEIDSICLT